MSADPPDTTRATDGSLVLRPVGFARTPHKEKADAPRQPDAARGIAGTLEIFPEYRDALADVDGFERLVVLFGFDRAPRTSSLKVLPPRSEKKRGVFATRSPHRPNPIGLSVLRLVRIDGLSVHVEDVDLLDGTPIYDIKPYLAYTDAYPTARAGWLEETPRANTNASTDVAPERVAGGGLDACTPDDPRAAYEVVFTDEARAACAFVEAATGVALARRIREHLALGPEPHAYRRIRREGATSVLSVKEWRAVFVASDARRIEVVRVRSGYSPRDLARDDPSLDVHRELVARFGR